MYLYLYVVIAIISFICFVLREKKTTGFHNDEVMIFCFFMFSVFWFVFVPIFLIIFILKKFVKIITGEAFK